jgi:hypothetical protein
MHEQHAVIALDCALWRDQALRDARETKQFISHDPQNRDMPENRERITESVQRARSWNRHARDYRNSSKK